MARLFGLGRSKSKSSVEAAAAATAADEDHASGQEQQQRSTNKVKKSKSFKRIRGLLKKTVGGGRNKKPAAVANDEQSLYGVDVDDRSVMTRQTNQQQGGGGITNTSGASSPAGGISPSGGRQLPQLYILKVVLLLMDPETRRFELLQLEFDSLKAFVSDVLAQIPISVTEDALRLQTYTGIVGYESQEMAPSKLLATFCKGSEVLVAVPDGVPPRECVRLARPILSDVKVVTMVRSFLYALGRHNAPKQNARLCYLDCTHEETFDVSSSRPVESMRRGGRMMPKRIVRSDPHSKPSRQRPVGRPCPTKTNNPGRNHHHHLPKHFRSYLSCCVH
jgi:hypothetical protein